jgi:hypothetical protein
MKRMHFLVSALFASSTILSLVPSAQAQKAPSVKSLNGTWVGTYTCAQGLTNLRLVIDAESQNQVNAVFNFSANNTNPSVPSGSFRMVGTYKNSNSPIKGGLLELRGTTWIKRPKNYVPVNLSANVAPSGFFMSGNVTGNSACTTFDLTKEFFKIRP